MRNVWQNRNFMAFMKKSLCFKIKPQSLCVVEFSAVFRDPPLTLKATLMQLVRNLYRSHFAAQNAILFFFGSFNVNKPCNGFNSTSDLFVTEYIATESMESFPRNRSCVCVMLGPCLL